MADSAPQFESSDLQGSTTHFNGAVGTTPVSIPASPGAVISEILIDNVNTAASKVLLVSFDGGTTFKKIPAGGVLEADPRGGLTQIQIKGAVASTDYEILINREP